jgi:hypothetical protein
MSKFKSGDNDMQDIIKSKATESMKNVHIKSNTFRIFENNGNINFVDKNNVVVGFGLMQDCCERAGWFISDKKDEEFISLYEAEANNQTETEEGVRGFDLEGYVFASKVLPSIVPDNNVGGGGHLVFEMTSENGGPPLYVHIFNDHNGYYAHGWELLNDGKLIVQGRI